MPGLRAGHPRFFGWPGQAWTSPAMTKRKNERSSTGTALASGVRIFRLGLDPLRLRQQFLPIENERVVSGIVGRRRRQPERSLRSLPHRLWIVVLDFYHHGV